MVVIGKFLLFIVFLCCFPWLLPRREQKPLDDAARKQMPEKLFVKLSDGYTHFEWMGPESGPKVVFIHGFSSPMFIFDHNARSLADAGFRVLRYDLYGRGYSDRPRTRYTADLFIRQLHELLASQNIQEPFDLIGLSMGGGLAMHYVDRYPEQVGKVVLFAPVGFNDLPGASWLMRMPGLGEWLMRLSGEKTLLKGVLRQLGDDPAAKERFRQAYDEQLKYKGCTRALLSTLRYGPLAHQEGVYHRAGKQSRRGLLFWGTEDDVVPFALHRPVLNAVSWLRFHPIPGGLHTANYQRAEEIQPIMLTFLRES